MIDACGVVLQEFEGVRGDVRRIGRRAGLVVYHCQRVSVCGKAENFFHEVDTSWAEQPGNADNQGAVIAELE